MAARGVFGIEQVPIHLEIEDAFRSHDEGKRFDNMLVVGKNIIRRTDGPLCIVSRYAVL
jgi:hypothetical protein